MYRLLKKYRFFALFLLAAGVLFLWQSIEQAHSPYLRVHFFDVGQGDAEFFETPGGVQVLIDGGPSNAVLKSLSQAMPFWDRTIDLVVITHPQLDHISGLVEVLKRYKVREMLMTGVTYHLDAYRALLEGIRQKHVSIHFVRGGEVLQFDHDITARLLSPDEAFAGKASPGEINETSVVLRLDYGKSSFLFTGDAGFPAERDMIADHDAVDVDVLKVGHHGSKYASSMDFLRAVSPKVAVIEVGRTNRYGHPTDETLRRLAAVGARVLRTDRDGDITLVSDGERIARERAVPCIFFCD